MKRFLLSILLLFSALPLSAQNSASGSITASTTTCAAPNTCVWESPLPPNAATTTINVSGTFSATLLVEESNNAGLTWATAATLSTTGTTTYSVNGFTDIRVRCSAFTSGPAVVTISTGLNTGPIGPAGPAGGSSSPSSLTTFFGGLMGLSPKDPPYNAFGDWQARVDCSSATNVITCSTSTPFVVGDIGKLFEFNCFNNFTCTTGTITAFNSSSAVQVSAAPGTVGASAVMEWGHDDTAALRQWASDISTNITGSGSSHSGYLPKGVYYTTKPVRFVTQTQPGAGVAVVDSNCLITTLAAPNNLCNDALILSGDGNTMSIIKMATAGNFTWSADGTSANTGLMYLTKWSSYQLTNFTLEANASQQTTSGQSGLVGGLVLDANAHGYVNNVWTQGFKNTTHTLGGLVTSATEFETWIQPYSEANDQAMLVCQGTGTCEKQTFANGFLEQSTTWAANIGTNSGTTTLKQLRFENLHFISPTSQLVVFGTSVTSGSSTDSVVFDKCRWENTTGPTGVAFSFSGANAISIDLVDPVMISSGTSTQTLIGISGTGALRLRINGGSLNNASTCVSACIVSNTNANAFVFIGNTSIFPENSTDAAMFGGSAVANIATLHDTTSPLGAGMGTRGSITAGQYGTFTNCAVNSVSPAACGSASSGAFVVPTGTTAYTVNTTAVTAASRINVTPMSFAGNLPSAPTCVVPTTPFIAAVSAISAGTSFSLTLPNTTGQTCWQYQIVN